MKKILLYLSTLLLSTLYSCDLLNLAPEDYYGSGSFWKNEAQVNTFITGIHANVRNNYQRFFVLGEARGGTSLTGTSIVNTSIDLSSPIKTNTFADDKTGISGWYGIYSTILQINLLIDQLENHCAFLSDASRDKYLAVGYGMRAMHYFLLYRTYGGVPIITRVKVLDGQIFAKDLYTARSTPKETLDFIKEDISKSETHYGTNTTIDASKAYWSKYATLMLKGEIYLWSAKVTTGDQAPAASDLATAKAAIQTVLGGPFLLEGNFADVFKKKGNNEVIYGLRFMDKESTNWGSSFVSADNLFIGQVYDMSGKLVDTDILQTKGTGLLRHEYKEGLWRSYNEKDTRRDATFFAFTVKSGAFGTVLVKSLGSINSENNRIYDTDVIVYRLSDAMLMMAEIENKMGNPCATYINKVRERAFGSNYSAEFAYTDSDFETNELAILGERDREFVWEGKRWFDVVRMQDASGNSLVFSPKANYAHSTDAATEPILTKDKAYMTLWPIDKATLNNDPLIVQTTGYTK